MRRVVSIRVTAVGLAVASVLVGGGLAWFLIAHSKEAVNFKAAESGSIEGIEPVLEGVREIPLLRSTARKAVPIDPPEAQSETIRVVKPKRGGVITGASVYLHGVKEETYLGATNEDGLLGAALPPSGHLIAVSAEYVSEYHSYAVDRDDPRDVIEIVTIPAGRITGKVTHVDMTPAAQVHVLVAARGLPRSTAFSNGDWPSNIVQVTESASDGTFRLDGLNPEGDYMMFAGKTGYLARKPVAVKTGSNPVEITVGRVYGLALRLEGASGASIEVAQGLYGPYHGSMQCADDAASRVTVGPECMLAGIQPHLLRQTESKRLFLYTHPAQPESVGPLQFTTQTLGYENAQHRFDARPVEEGIPVGVIRVGGLAADMGSLRVHITGLPDALRKAHGTLPRCFICLEAPRGRDPGQGPRNLKFVVDHSRTIELNPVPAGEYEVHYRADAFQWPDRSERPRMTIDPGQQAVVEFDMSAFGALELHVRRTGGVLHRGAVRVVSVFQEPVTRETPQGLFSGPASTRGFDSPPYVVWPLEPGRHLVFISNPFYSASVDEPTFATITGGQVVTLTIEE